MRAWLVLSFSSVFRQLPESWRVGLPLDDSHQCDTRTRTVTHVPEIFHIMVPEAWTQAQHTGAITTSTRGVSLAEEGFVHCSYAGQVAATAARFFGDLAEVVLLRIDPARLAAPLVTEDLTGAGEPFPHVYGPINLDAVVAATVVAPLQIEP